MFLNSEEAAYSKPHFTGRSVFQSDSPTQSGILDLKGEKIMQIKVTSRHFELDDRERAFAEEEVSKLQRYFNNIIDAHLILEQEKSRLTAELGLKVYGTVLVARSNGFEPVSAVEKVTNIMQRRLKKYKAKLQDKKAKGRSLEKRTINGPGVTPQE